METQKEFVPYIESLALKELGFDKPCFGYYYLGCLVQDYTENQNYSTLLDCLAPTFSQAFKFFREKYNLYPEVRVQDNIRLGEQEYYWMIFGGYKTMEGNSWIRCLKDSNVMFKTYEEAELECLKELIKTVKNERLKN